MNNEERIKNNIGRVYGDYIIIGTNRKNDKYNTLAYICKCNICDHIQERTLGELNRRPLYHSMASCSEDFLKHYSDNSNNDYKFIESTGMKYSNNSFLYKFKCKICGNEIYLTSDSYQRNKYMHCYSNCGEIAYLDEIDNIYDDYKIIEYLGIKNNTTPIYLCECQICHRQKIMQISNIKSHHGTTHHSCSSLLNRANLPYINEFKSRWANMIDRTTNPNNQRYNVYGGRGIKSDEFTIFVDFFDAMYPSFIDHVNKYGVSNTTLERIDVDGDYCKSNCKWVTWEEQFQNKQDTIYFSITDENGNVEFHRNLSNYCNTNGVLGLKFNIFNRLNGTVQNTPINGNTYQRISKEEYEKNSKLQICQIVSDEDKEKYLKLIKEEYGDINV